MDEKFKHAPQDKTMDLVRRIENSKARALKVTAEGITPKDLKKLKISRHITLTLKMKVLIACEYSGIVRDAFSKKGHDAWSCDILPTESPGKHLQGDVLNYLNDDWDMMIAHPPCTYISNAGARHLYPKGVFK